MTDNQMNIALQMREALDDIADALNDKNSLSIWETGIKIGINKLLTQADEVGIVNLKKDNDEKNKENKPGS